MRLVQDVLLQIERIQSCSKPTALIIFRRIVSSVRLLLVVINVSEDGDDIFDEEPQLISLLWDVIQELMDEISNLEQDMPTEPRDELPPHSLTPLQVSMAALAIHGMLLMTKSQSAFVPSDDDLMLMIHYSLKLHDIHRLYSNIAEAERINLSWLVMGLMQAVLSQITHCNRDRFMNSKMDETKREQRLDYYEYFDILLGALIDDLITKNNNTEVWELVSELHVMLGNLKMAPLPPVPRTVDGNSLQDKYSCESPQLILSKMSSHPRHIVMTKRLLQRWATDAADSLRFLQTLPESLQTATESTSQNERNERELEDDDHNDSEKSSDLVLGPVEQTSRSITDILAIVKLVKAH
ncbi:hypothetical protein BGZ46_002065 [Entomortierella lignicola]|nr:hypothetical protein BGZ46_002065 [Entomortierella lignicola]